MYGRYWQRDLTCSKCGKVGIKTKNQLCDDCMLEVLDEYGLNKGLPAYSLIRNNKDGGSVYRVESGTIVKVWKSFNSDYAYRVQLKKPNNILMQKYIEELYPSETKCIENNMDRIKESIKRIAMKNVMEELDKMLDTEIDEFTDTTKGINKDNAKLKEILCATIDSYKARQEEVEKFTEEQQKEISAEIKKKYDDTTVADIQVMAQQDLICRQLEQFLSSSLAKQFGIVGINAKIDKVKNKEYINAEWKFLGINDD